MLVWLADYLTQYVSAFNVFSYLTFRSILGILTAFNGQIATTFQLFQQIVSVKIVKIYINLYFGINCGHL